MNSTLARRLAPYLRAFLLPFDSSHVSTWTPGLAGATTPGTFVYSAQTGRYTRLGNLTIARGRLLVSSVSVAPVGGLRITGLPFTVANVNPPGDCTLGRISLFNFSAGALMLVGQATANQTYITLTEVFDNLAAAAAPSTGVQANTDFSFTVIYEVAS